MSPRTKIILGLLLLFLSGVGYFYLQFLKSQDAQTRSAQQHRLSGKR